MNNLIPVLLQSSVSIAILFAIYYFFMKRDTFFMTNRWYLVSSLIISILIPFIDFSILLPAREQIYMVLLEPVIISPEGLQASVEENLTIFQIFMSIYLTGVCIFTLRFLYQLIQLFMLVRKYGISHKAGMRLVFTDKNYAPFSFFKLVFLNSTDIESIDSQKILAHEKIHIKQWHSLDLMLLEIITIVLWFNPFIWLYHHAIKTLHEYLADEGVLHSGVDANVYSALLFRQSTGIQINDLTNNFSKSLLKKRFIMMTRKRSTRLARIKLLLVLPLAFTMMLLISLSPDAIGQQNEKVPPPQGEKLVTESSPDVPPPPEKAPKVIKITEVPQDQDEPKAPIFTVVEEMPAFPGGKEAMFKYLVENITYPEKAKKAGVVGTVFVTYVVEKDGLVTNVKLLRGVEETLDAEAIRVVKAMPIWTPGKQRGETVRVQYSLPIKFTLDNAEKEDKK